MTSGHYVCTCTRGHRSVLNVVLYLELFWSKVVVSGSMVIHSSIHPWMRDLHKVNVIRASPLSHGAGGFQNYNLIIPGIRLQQGGQI